MVFADLRPDTKYTIYVVEDKIVDPRGKLVITDDIKDTCILQVISVSTINDLIRVFNYKYFRHQLCQRN